MADSMSYVVVAGGGAGRPVPRDSLPRLAPPPTPPPHLPRPPVRPSPTEITTSSLAGSLGPMLALVGLDDGRRGQGLRGGRRRRLYRDTPSGSQGLSERRLGQSLTLVVPESL